MYEVVCIREVPMERLLARYTNSYLSYVLMYLFYNISFALFSAMISVYLIGKGYSASDVSLCVSVGSLSAMITQPIIGGLTDRFGMRPVNLTMFGIVCLAAMGVVAREIGLGLAILMATVQTLLAWAVAVLLYQVPVGGNTTWIVAAIVVLVGTGIFLKLFGIKANKEKRFED